jgi:hypothetical protein
MDKQEYFKQYRENNLERIAEYSRQYYLKNKEKYEQKIECECGRYYDIKHKNRHYNTEIHKRNLDKKLITEN